MRSDVPAVDHGVVGQAEHHGDAMLVGDIRELVKVVQEFGLYAADRAAAIEDQTGPIVAHIDACEATPVAFDRRISAFQFLLVRVGDGTRESITQGPGAIDAASRQKVCRGENGLRSALAARAW